MPRIDLKKKLNLAFNNIHYIPEYLKNRLREITRLDYRILNGKSMDPLFVNWGITARCNLDCDMCWLKEKDVVDPKYIEDELSFEEAKEIIDDLARKKPLINFGGGEPFAREDIVDILKYTKSKDLICSVITNGTLLSGQVEKIIDTGLDSITFSLDGPKEVHDRIRGEGSFEKTIESIESFLDKREDKRPIVKVNSTVSSVNYDRLEELYNLVNDLNVDYLRFQHLWFMDDEDAKLHRKCLKDLFGLDWKAGSGYVSEIEFSIDELWEEIKRVKSKGQIPVSFYPELHKEELEKYYNNPRENLRETCLYPWMNAHIKPNGDLISCLGYILPYKYGNLKENSFEELWNGEKAKKFRKTLKEKKLFPGCKRCCGLFEH